MRETYTEVEMAFTKLLASIGIGNAKIDTVVENEKICPGSELSGKIFVQGGGADQEI